MFLINLNSWKTWFDLKFYTLHTSPFIRIQDSPCIWPTVRSLSSLSIPAKSSILGTGQLRNVLDKPLNQPDQYFSVRPRSIRHTYFCMWLSLSVWKQNSHLWCVWHVYMMEN